MDVVVNVIKRLRKNGIIIVIKLLKWKWEMRVWNAIMFSFSRKEIVGYI